MVCQKQAMETIHEHLITLSRLLEKVAYDSDTQIEKIHLDGYLYSTLGLAIKCIADSWFESHRTSITHHNQNKTRALVRDSIIIVNKLIDAKIDIDIPCYVDPEGEFEYYTPLQYVCLLHKILIPGKWVKPIVEKLLLADAKPVIPHDLGP